MQSKTDVLKVAERILDDVPHDWLALTTHRLDIYNESLAKTEFLQHLDKLTAQGTVTKADLEKLPTAYDYIRLGHPLSCVLEWVLADVNKLTPAQVIAFSSATMPVLAVLRAAHLQGRKTVLYHDHDLPDCFDAEAVRDLFGYSFDVCRISGAGEIKSHESDVVLFCTRSDFSQPVFAAAGIHMTINQHAFEGSVIIVHDAAAETDNERAKLIGDIQHVRRRETIAMTPKQSLRVLREVVSGDMGATADEYSKQVGLEQSEVSDPIYQSVRESCGSSVRPLIASSGLSMQYAITLGLIEHFRRIRPEQKIKLLVPANCYGGTNDQARRVARGFMQVDYADLHVDGDADMVTGLEEALSAAAREDMIPLIIAEIPTNPRVEVPDMSALRETLCQPRKTSDGADAAAPVFVLDQTFCPNIPFLADDAIPAQANVISYVSGSKFPSAGHCTAGYCVANRHAEPFMAAIEAMLRLCDNQATPDQLQTLAEKMPSMRERISGAFANTKKFVDGIRKILPEAKISCIADDLTGQGFTPSVFSLDMPAKGGSADEREQYKRELDERLIAHMIENNPADCKYCVSYGQPKATYWTIPATSTQGTTQEGHKDYLVRVSVSPNVDVDRLVASFAEFCRAEKLID